MPGSLGRRRSFLSYFSARGITRRGGVYGRVGTLAAVVAAALLIAATVASPGCGRRVRPPAVPQDPYASLSAEERVTKYQEVLTASPGDALTHFRLGNAYYDLKQLGRAADEYRRAVELDPQTAGAFANLGTVLDEMDDKEGALQAYEKAVELLPKDAAAWSNLGSAYYALGRHAEAVDAYREALRLDANNVQAHYNLGVAFADARIYREALRHWQRVMELDPESQAGKSAQRNIAMIGSLREAESHRLPPKEKEE